MPTHHSIRTTVAAAWSLVVLVALLISSPPAAAERKPISRDYPAVTWCPLNQSPDMAQSGFVFRATASSMILRFFADTYNEADDWNGQRLDHLVVVEERVYRGNNPNRLVKNEQGCYEPDPTLPTTDVLYFDFTTAPGIAFKDTFDSEPAPGWVTPIGKATDAMGKSSTEPVFWFPAESAPQPPSNPGSGSMGLGRKKTGGDIPVALASLRLDGLTVNRRYVVTGWWSMETGGKEPGTTLTIDVTGAGDPPAYMLAGNPGLLRVIGRTTFTQQAALQLSEPTAQVLGPGDRLYVAGADPTQQHGYVSIIDTKAQRVIDTLFLPLSPTAIAIDPAGTHLYVAGTGWIYGGTLADVDLATGRVRSVPAISRDCTGGESRGVVPVDLEVSEPRGKLYMTGKYDFLVPIGPIVYDLSTLAENRCLKLLQGSSQRPVMAMRASGDRLYLVDSVHQRIAVIDTSTDQVVGELSPGALAVPSDLSIARDGSPLVAAGEFLPGNEAKIIAFDTATGAKLHEIHSDLIGLPDRVAVASDGGLVLGIRKGFLDAYLIDQPQMPVRYALPLQDPLEITLP